MTDISGVWLGTYWEGVAQTRFEMVLLQGNQVLQGRILDDGILGEALLQGEFFGTHITFTKQYLTHSRHSVVYEGTLASDANFMQGYWQIRGTKGAWEAQRKGEHLVLSRQRPRQVTVSLR